MELTKNELSIISELVGNYARDLLDKAIDEINNGPEEPSDLKARLEQAVTLYRKVLNEIHGK